MLLLCALLRLLALREALVDERQHTCTRAAPRPGRQRPNSKESGGGTRTSTGDGGADEGVELLVAADGELEVAGGYAFYAQVFRRVSWISQERSAFLYHSLRTRP